MIKIVKDVLDIMEITYDEIADSLYLYFDDTKIGHSERVSSSILIDFNIEGKVRGIEVLEFSKSKLDLNQLIRLSKNELIARVTSK